jgi:excisionase family DNA binding protein
MTETQVGQSGGWMAMWLDDEWVKVFSTQDAADQLGLSQGYVRQLCEQEKIVATKLDGRWWVHEQRYGNLYVDWLPF